MHISLSRAGLAKQHREKKSCTQSPSHRKAMKFITEERPCNPSFDSLTEDYYLSMLYNVVK